MAIALTGAGLSTLVLLWGSGLFVTYDPQFASTLRMTLLFVGFAVLMLWLLYGPALGIRWLAGGSGRIEMVHIEFLYHASLMLAPLLCIAALMTTGALPTLVLIFSTWCLVITTLAAMELIKEESAFATMLTEGDRARFKFALQGQPEGRLPLNRRQMGLGITVTAAILVIALLVKIFG